ncbi:MAG: toll/interleukin-1 receptor domain-containing protein, partial [Gemmatirosa sp.]|nr:toll/interleukin-1 receptor domain-containing protein [Gemmatirosa sp.]
MPHDVFVSYAHSDNEAPASAEHGWVTTFMRELRKVLRRKMGGEGPTIWMDESLAANERVPETLRDTVRDARTMVLFMSRGYLRSGWCQGELDEFLRVNAAHKNHESVFVVAMDETDRERWPLRVRALTPVALYRPADPMARGVRAGET